MTTPITDADIEKLAHRVADILEERAAERDAQHAAQRRKSIEDLLDDPKFGRREAQTLREALQGSTSDDGALVVAGGSGTAFLLKGG